ncbi:hypothetical protein SAY87_012803 [Trapa incisa]|uniref:Xyloglucan endo-transglycosylase C-terminal domain-containing protein n=1 Tax=Trapa incisa TaxID=236973 RepID=A0AAN7GLL8_9MYRT|nr:hypothetical protein SAY87_012803 [Trapa incisa]
MEAMGGTTHQSQCPCTPPSRMPLTGSPPVPASKSTTSTPPSPPTSPTSPLRVAPSTRSSSADVASPCSAAATSLMSKAYSVLTPRRRAAMNRFRQRYMYYYYCYDSIRYPVPPPECVIDLAKRARYHDTGRLKFGSSHRRRPRRTAAAPSYYVNADIGADNM